MSCCSSSNRPSAETNDITAFLGENEESLKLPISILYGDREIQHGFHITEIKKARISAMDCGANRDSWSETVIQLLDVDGPEASRMSFGKFKSILKKANVELLEDTSQQIVFEIARPGENLQLHDFKILSKQENRFLAMTGPRQAVCKPASRRQNSSEGGCCATSAKASSACCG